MSRKNESILNLLMRLPWWVSVVAAAVAYFVLRFAVPVIPIGDPFAKAFVKGVSSSASIFALILLMPGMVSAFRAWRNSRLLEEQTGRGLVRELSWQQFETLVGEVFRKRGYRVLENPDNGPDGGVDLRLWKDGKKVYVQCKHWKRRNVGVKAVRELYGAMTAKGAGQGFVVTSGGFTPEAREFASGKPLLLVDGDKLDKMIQEAQKPQGAGQVSARSLPVQVLTAAQFLKGSIHSGPSWTRFLRTTCFPLECVIFEGAELDQSVLDKRIDSVENSDHVSEAYTS